MPRKSFEPSPDHRKMVKAMSGYGIPEEDIALVITNPETGKPITAKTLRKHFREELDTAEVIANSKVAESLYNHATKGTGAPAVTAAIFWLKTRARWKETDRLELTGKDGSPITFQNLSDEQAEKMAEAYLSTLRLNGRKTSVAGS